MALDTGDKAADFDLPTDTGNNARLSDFAGKPVVVYFYPKDDTSGCTQEAIDFTALSKDFAAIGVPVIGVSPDSAKSHGKVRGKFQLDVVLAADEGHAIAEAYGVWVEKSMYGRKYMGVERSTFLIDPSGRIAMAWHKVKVPGHAAAVLTAAKQLHASSQVA